MTDLDLDLTPKNKRTNLRRSYAIADITALVSGSDAAESEHEMVTNDEYQPLHQIESVTDEIVSDNEPTPKKKQKIKVPVREAINANRKEHEPHTRKAENKVGRLPVIVID